MTYKLELFLVIQKKKKKFINIKSFKNYIFYSLLILDSSFFYTKLTHLTQKLKKLRLDGTHGTKLNFN